MLSRYPKVKYHHLKGLRSGRSWRVVLFRFFIVTLTYAGAIGHLSSSRSVFEVDAVLIELFQYLLV